MKGRNSIFLLILFCLSIFQGRTTQLFDQGIEAVNKKNYNQAIEHFENVIKTQKGNASAYFNLGLCYSKIKQYGKAIWAYERVLNLSPKDGEAPQNIEICYTHLHAQTQWVPHTNGLQRMIYSIDSNIWASLSILISCLIGLSIFFYFKTKDNSWKRLNFFFLIGEATLIIIFIICTKSSSSHYMEEKFALVTKKSIPSYMNETGDLAQLKLLEGTKVELIKCTDKMSEVMLEDGRKILVKKDDIEII